MAPSQADVGSTPSRAGLPELSLPAAAASSSTTAPERVEQLLFFATHEVSAMDARLLHHYTLQLRDAVRTALWVLLYRPALEQVETGESVALGLPVCAWGDGALRRELPRLSEQIGRIARLGEGLGEGNEGRYSSTKTKANQGRYFWFHSTLLLWNVSFGHAYPSLRFLWRVEPDVVYAGSLGMLVKRTSITRSDLLMPSLRSWEQHRSYPHWQVASHTYLQGVSRKLWKYGLVSMTRLSSRFLAQMAVRWRAGVIGYEEILLPMTCAAAEGCELSTFGELRAREWRNRSLDYFFRYRPDWECADFLGAAARHTSELWHPLKMRGCWVDFLDSCNATGCTAAVPPLRSHCRTLVTTPSPNMPPRFLVPCAGRGGDDGSQSLSSPRAAYSAADVSASEAGDCTDRVSCVNTAYEWRAADPNSTLHRHPRPVTRHACGCPAM